MSSHNSFTLIFERLSLMGVVIEAINTVIRLNDSSFIWKFTCIYRPPAIISGIKSSLGNVGTKTATLTI
jgi:hypothetical protein